MTLTHLTRNGLHFGFGETAEESEAAARGIGSGAITFTMDQWDLIESYVKRTITDSAQGTIQSLQEELAEEQLNNTNFFPVLISSKEVSVLRLRAGRLEIFIPDAGDVRTAEKISKFLNEERKVQIDKENRARIEAYTSLNSSENISEIETDA